ncbi:MAG: hypothetical protein HWE12_02585 [Oceanospirillaceae bacterium]|nr:hypothetical protein [Oceanospirillaceae bacterium]
MEVISHRGYWKTASEKNTETAFIRSFKLGLGTETDIRDLDGEVVISHDIPLSKNNPLSLAELLELYSEFGCKGTLALNVKADGLQYKVMECIEASSLTNYVLFDMSVPDQLVTQRAGLNYLTRMSDLEPVPALLNDSVGVWIDEFNEGWLTIAMLENILDSGKRAFIVSPELHGRGYLQLWSMIKPYVDRDLVLCTDFPEDAKSYFGV